MVGVIDSGSNFEKLNLILVSDLTEKKVKTIYSNIVYEKESNAPSPPTRPREIYLPGHSSISNLMQGLE